MVATQLCKHQNPPTSTHERSRMLCIRKWYLSKEEEREGWKEKGNKEGSQEGKRTDNDDGTVRRMLVGEGSAMVTILMSCWYTYIILFNHSIQKS